MAEQADGMDSVRGLPELMLSECRVPDYPTVPELLSLMRSPDEGERDAALSTLAEVVGAAFGEDGAEIGRAVRSHGGPAILTWLLADPNPVVQQLALMVLGNLCSDSVDQGELTICSNPTAPSRTCDEMTLPWRSRARFMAIIIAHQPRPNPATQQPQPPPAPPHPSLPSHTVALFRRGTDP